MPQMCSDVFQLVPTNHLLVLRNGPHLHGNGIVCATLHGGIICYQSNETAMYTAYASDNAS